ncbi:hypothetical protein KIL84_005073 [Mauremys mutica]|uniref:Uncharacterized protein n=1 Tax=Mauremys mutica TaxID=74926 RepID=A0A9D4AYL1_9SAUR|nr:hypothetical protein KIL84_005073 [Mauremys mutica]
MPVGKGLRGINAAEFYRWVAVVNVIFTTYKVLCVTRLITSPKPDICNALGSVHWSIDWLSHVSWASRIWVDQQKCHKPSRQAPLRSQPQFSLAWATPFASPCSLCFNYSDRSPGPTLGVAPAMILRGVVSPTHPCLAGVTTGSTRRWPNDMSRLLNPARDRCPVPGGWPGPGYFRNRKSAINARAICNNRDPRAHRSDRAPQCKHTNLSAASRVTQRPAAASEKPAAQPAGNRGAWPGPAGCMPLPAPGAVLPWDPASRGCHRQGCERGQAFPSQRDSSSCPGQYVPTRAAPWQSHSPGQITGVAELGLGGVRMYIISFCCKTACVYTGLPWGCRVLRSTPYRSRASSRHL